MRLVLVPRIENISWSLYWKEAMTVDTQCLECMELQLEGSGALTGQALLEQAAAKMGWPPATSLQRLDDFKEPWERLIFRGREIKGEQDIKSAGVKEGDRVVIVRRKLAADGWKVAMADDFCSDDEDL